MRKIIKRGSKTHLFLFFGSIFIILGGVVATIVESIGSFGLVLLGFGLLFFTFSLSEVEKKSFEVLSDCSDVFMIAAIFWTSYFYFLNGKIITSKLFALAGILILFLTLYSIFKRRKTT
ncbi:MAG: hypothetical protein K8R25_16930 [Methanosarcinales archaeon]|nr:hypothetical protein [Methanosarcinales archaeon]